VHIKRINVIDFMRRICVIIFALCLLYPNIGKAEKNNNSNNPEIVFGNIRKEMLVKGCELLGVSDSVKSKITSISVDDFKAELRKEIEKDSTKRKATVLLQAPKIGPNVDGSRSKLDAFNKALKEISRFPFDSFDERIKMIANLLNQVIQKDNSINQLNTELETIKAGIENSNGTDSEKKDSLEKALSEKEQELALAEKENEELREKIYRQNTGKKKYDISDILYWILDIIFWILPLLLVIIAIGVIFIMQKNRRNRNKNNNLKELTSTDQPIEEKKIQSVDITRNNDVNSESKETALPADDTKKSLKKEEKTSDILEDLQKNIIVIDKGAFATDADDWVVVGASVQGNGHKATNTPCQDSHSYEYLGNGWGIAIVSDGAGSAKNAEKGSKIVSNRAMFHFKNLITHKQWVEKNVIPSDQEWEELAFRVLKQVRDDMNMVAQKTNEPLKSLNATAIVVIHTPDAILSTHVGDGRAGYRDAEGNWKPLITPHKGEEANQTIFLTSDFWDIPFFKLSDTRVPESKITHEKPYGFVLMSDGSEASSWEYNLKVPNEERFYDPNRPFPGFFNPISNTLINFRKQDVPLEERAEKWWSFIESGNSSFVKEQDDKTMIVGVLISE